MNRRQNILVCPLDWGLGHASRCVPIIRNLIARNYNVIIGADRGPYNLLRMEFPDLKLVRLPGYDIRYSKKGATVSSMLPQVPRILRRTAREHRTLKRLVYELDIHGVISDNRFGLWSDTVPSVYITHQVAIRTPQRFSLFSSTLEYLHSRLIENYSYCWIPDIKGDMNLSGDLTHKPSRLTNLRFVGILSRFKPLPQQPRKYDILVILSGPEPQRTIFEDIVLEQVRDRNYKVLIARGLPSNRIERGIKGNVEMVNHLTSEKLNQAVASSEIILSRTGYCTVLDLVKLGSKAIMVPTPGQTEQEYLAVELKKKKIYYCVSQDKFNLETALAESSQYSGLLIGEKEEGLFNAAMDEFLNAVEKHTSRKQSGFKQVYPHT